MKFIHRELSNLIEQFECTIVQELQNDYISIPVHQLINTCTHGYTTHACRQCVAMHATHGIGW